MDYADPLLIEQTLKACGYIGLCAYAHQNDNCWKRLTSVAVTPSKEVTITEITTEPQPLRSSDTCSEQPFERWMIGVDKFTQRQIGLSVHDLPDMRFRDAYDAGSSIRAFFDDEVRTMLAEEGYTE